ncbi:MAG: heavy-metal-associated domain-containing protein [Candidatus Nanohaloarchaea archaeon]
MASDQDNVVLELDVIAVAVGIGGAVLSAAPTLLPTLFYTGQAGVFLSKNQPVFQLTGAVLVLAAALYQGRNLEALVDWRALYQGGLLFLAGFILLQYAVVPIAAGAKTSGSGENLGDGNLKVVYLKVDGMVCQGCQASINGYLKRQPGVRYTGITLGKQGGPVVYDPELTSAEEIANSQIFGQYYDAQVERVTDYTGDVA